MFLAVGTHHAVIVSNIEKEKVMNIWITTANDLIVTALGDGYSSPERIIIAACGFIAFFLTLKLFTKMEGGVNSASVRRLLAAVLIWESVLFGAVAADILVVPYITSALLQKISFVLLPLFIIILVAAPLLMLVLKKDYSGVLLVSMSTIVAGAIAVFAVGFVVSSLQGSGVEFTALRNRSSNITNFISR